MVAEDPADLLGSYQFCSYCRRICATWLDRNTCVTFWTWIHKIGLWITCCVWGRDDHKKLKGNGTYCLRGSTGEVLKYKSNGVMSCCNRTAHSKGVLFLWEHNKKWTKLMRYKFAYGDRRCNQTEMNDNIFFRFARRLSILYFSMKTRRRTLVQSRIKHIKAAICMKHTCSQPLHLQLSALLEKQNTLHHIPLLLPIGIGPHHRLGPPCVLV